MIGLGNSVSSTWEGSTVPPRSKQAAFRRRLSRSHTREEPRLHPLCCKKPNGNFFNRELALRVLPEEKHLYANRQSDSQRVCQNLREHLESRVSRYLELDVSYHSHALEHVSCGFSRTLSIVHRRQSPPALKDLASNSDSLLSLARTL